MTFGFGIAPWGLSPWGLGEEEEVNPWLWTNHEERMLDLVLSQFRYQPRYMAIIKAIAQQVQALENDCAATLAGIMLDAAEGEQLDIWGSIVGQAREGLSDTIYRAWIAARIVSNIGHGEPWRMTQVLATLLGSWGTVQVRYSPLYPAALYFQAIVTGLPPVVYRAKIGAWMASITPAGVGLHNIVLALVPFFAFAEPDDPTTPELDNCRGFGETVTDTDGGIIAESIAVHAI